MKQVPPRIILIRETTLQSWLHDAGTFAMFVGLIGVGRWLDSPAMQWAGVIMGFISVFGWAVMDRRKDVLTIAEARASLDAMEGKG